MATRSMGTENVRDIYPSNSITAKQQNKPSTSENDIQKPKPKQVAQAKVRKKSAVGKFSKNLVEDSIVSARDKAMNEVIIPGVRQLIFDAITDTTSVILFGRDAVPQNGYARRGSVVNGYSNQYTNYAAYSRNSMQYQQAPQATRGSVYMMDQIIFATRGEAVSVLNEMNAAVHQYGQVSVGDFYDLSGITSSNWADNRYGWIGNIGNPAIIPVRDGFEVQLPPPVVLPQ